MTWFFTSTVDSLYLEHPLSRTSLYLELKSQSLCVGCNLLFSLYLELSLSRTNSLVPCEFEIERVNCARNIRNTKFTTIWLTVWPQIVVNYYLRLIVALATEMSCKNSHSKLSNRAPSTTSLTLLPQEVIISIVIMFSKSSPNHLMLRIGTLTKLSAHWHMAFIRWCHWQRWLYSETS